MNDEIITINDDVQNYFDDIKSKINKIDLDTLNKNLNEISSFIERAEKIGQKSLARELRNNLALIVSTKRVLNYGIDKYVTMDDIVKYIESIKGHVIKFNELEYFPRVIPNEVAEKILKCKENNLFDKYYILYTDYVDDELLTKEERDKRTINKDPIIFGEFDFYPKRYFVICDYVDEYCDITFDKFTEQLHKIDKNYKPNEVVEDNTAYVNKVLEIVKKEQLKKEKENDNMLYYRKSKNGFFNTIKKIFRL